MENIGVCKVNRNIAVGVGRSVVLKRDTRPVQLQSPLIIKHFCRNCAGWSRRKCKVPTFDSCGGGEVFACVRVSENGRANRVQPFVAIGMVKVPMRIDEVLDGLGTNPDQSVTNLWACTGKAGIDQ